MLSLNVKMGKCHGMICVVSVRNTTISKTWNQYNIKHDMALFLLGCCY